MVEPVIYYVRSETPYSVLPLTREVLEEKAEFLSVSGFGFGKSSDGRDVYFLKMNDGSNFEGNLPAYMITYFNYWRPISAKDLDSRYVRSDDAVGAQYKSEVPAE